MRVALLAVILCFSVVSHCESLFTGVTPNQMSFNDASPLSIGLLFSPKVDGSITAIKFYKGTGNTGTHTGALYLTAYAFFSLCYVFIPFSLFLLIFYY